jgi:hypothetical protein
MQAKFVSIWGFVSILLPDMCVCVCNTAGGHEPSTLGCWGKCSTTVLPPQAPMVFSDIWEVEEPKESTNHSVIS